MKRGTKNIIAVSIILSVMVAGVFCYKGVQVTMDDHCSSGVSSAWCNGILEHGTMIGSAILTTIITIFTTAVLILRVVLFRKINLNIRKKDILSFYIFLISPIKMALSNGIIHPRIP